MSANFLSMGIIGLIVIVVAIVVGVIVASGRSKSGSDAPKPPSPKPREDLSNFSRRAGEDQDGKPG